MRKLLMIIMLLAALQVKAQQIPGRWSGSVTFVGNSFKLVFNINKIADTSYSATFDSPDQKAFGIACSNTTVKKDSVSISIASAHIVYKGIWDGHDGISGVFQQGATRLVLNLKRDELIRPQTPKPPFNYYSEDVEYDNADKTLHYGATFTRPNGSGKYPAVIIISGSGSQNRNGTLFGHELYWVLADYLTKNGIAVLRVDDRGEGKSTIGPAGQNVTSMDFSHDVETSLNYLETRPDVNKKHLGLIGHSEGGIIAPMVAARRKDVSFIVLWAAPAVGGAKINTEQAGYALIRKRGVDSLSAQAFMNLNDEALPLLKGATSKDEFSKRVEPVINKWLNTQNQKTLTALSLANDSANRKALTGMYANFYTTPWVRFFFSYDPAVDLSKVSCSVLAIGGSKDTQVDEKTNLSAIKSILTKSGNKDFEVKELPGLNHLLQDAKTGDVDEYGTIEETMSPEALNIILNWVKLHTK